MDGLQSTTTTTTGRRENNQQQRRQMEDVEERERVVPTMREQLPSMRIQTRLLNSQLVSGQQEGTRVEHSQDYRDVAMGGEGGGGSGGTNVLSAHSDFSDRTVFDWHVQDQHHHYLSTPSCVATVTGEEERHATPGIEVRHGKEKWMPPPPQPPLLSLPSSQNLKHQQHNRTTQYRQSRSWSTTMVASPRNWARQTRIWLRQYFSTSRGTISSVHHPYQQRQQLDHHYSPYGSDDSPLASASSTSSASTFLSEGDFHSRHHSYFQGGHRHSSSIGSAASSASSATFLSAGDMESARLKKERYYWTPQLTPRWISSPRSISLPFRVPGSWNVFGRGRSKAGSLASPSSSSSTSTCLRLFTRMRKRTLHKWAWVASLMLVMTLGLYILIISISRIHGYLAGDSADGRNESLVSTGRDIWSNAWVGKTGTVKNAGKGGMKAELDSDKTVTTKQKDGVRGQANDPTAPVADVQDQAAIIPPGPIWVRRAEDEMDDPLDYYPDEDEDDPLEAASFISWLAQASLTAPKAQQQQDQQDQQQQQRRPQQPEGYQEPPRRQSQIAQESLLEPERYFTYMPYAGISNQFYGMLRAMSIARALDRTLILPPITSSSHDKSRQNQAWSEFFDLDEFRRRTGLKVIEYQDLRDRGSFRGATGVQGSGSSVGASWIPPWTKESETTESKGRRKGRYQHSLGTGTAVVDMTMPCHVTCGFGSKRDLDFTAKAFVRQWGFQYKKQMLPKSQPPASAGLTNTVDTSPIDLTRDLDRIVAALQDDSLKSEGFLCVSNTYKIQVAPSAIPVNSLVDSIEWHEFGQHLLFQPKLTHFVEEFLDKTFGEHPEERTKYTNDTFWISTRAPSVPPPVSSPLPDPGPISLPPPAQVNPPLLEPLSQPSDVEVNTQSLPTQASAIPVSYAASVDLTPWPPLRPLIQHTFFMIHVRRGDFETYCRKEFKDERFDQCLPSNEAYARVMDELQHRALRERSERDGTTSEEKERPQKRGKIPVLVATNEHRPEELTRLRQLGRARVHNVVVEGEQAVAQGGGIGGGAASSIAEEEGEDWIILDHEEMRTVERLGVFGPMMVEQLLMAEAEALVGVKMSTFSRVGGYRQRDWYRRRILYM